MPIESPAAIAFPADRELTLTRLIDAPRASVYRAWTDAQVLTRWFTPPPWTTPYAELDVRTGGSSFVLMKGPNGEEMPNRGVYLEVVPNERLVFTDAFTRAWEPSEKPFMLGILTFADEAGKTRYTATVRHWSAEDCRKHEEMGFHQGWGIATDQLEAVARSL